ncbi:hypothetical protein TRFO_12078 [Tritrichomonas foetus]|uniref:Translation initiation factor eIF2B subunit gamma n=1 Tax=Tritrichomonas foetus TaxID=1144522 RepID=A0A1J4J078_9EUKA|nr:hypothetical protein TRFO_12078 [Tritrichomonas foetus]|eukprot:OHS93062.1 hypothetical protein TRFO_12078 [Tritrichomonas foetus]
MITDGHHHYSPYSNIQVVIMANRPAFTRDSFGDSALFGLIPIANKPILGHLLDQFERFGISNVSIVCLRKDENAYTEFILQYTSHPVRLIPVEGVLTTCDIIRNKIVVKNSNEHIFLFPIDLLTSVNLTSIIDFHISTRSLVTIVASKQSIDEKEKRNAPGFQPVNVGALTGRRFFVYDELNPSKLITMLSDAAALSEDLDLSLKQVTMNDNAGPYISHEDSIESLGPYEDEEDGMSIDPAFLNGFKNLMVDCSMHPTTAYLLSPDCIAQLIELSDIHSIETELIPTLCKNEVESLNLTNNGESPVVKTTPASIFCIDEKDFAFRVTDYATLYIANMKCASTKLLGFSPSADFTLAATQNNNLGYYTEGKHKVHSSFQYSPFCVYGDNLTANAEDITVSRSVLGRHCKIGKGTKIYNSVLFDHVTVEEGVVLRDCLIGSDSLIKSNSRLSQCIVVPRVTTEKSLTREKCIIQSGSK